MLLNDVYQRKRTGHTIIDQPLSDNAAVFEISESIASFTAQMNTEFEPAQPVIGRARMCVRLLLTLNRESTPSWVGINGVRW